MRTPILATALLALVGATTTLAAQETTRRPAPERDDSRSMARTLMSRLAGDPDRPRLGISTESTGARDTLGVFVAEVTGGGPADRAGVKEGDRVVAINGVNLRLNSADAEDEEMQGVTQRRLTRELARHKAGDEVELRLTRDGKPMTLKVKTVDAEELAPRAMTFVGGVRANPDRASLGIGLGSTGSKRDTLGILVASLASDGPAEKAGLEEGDRIASINGVDLRVAREDIGDWASSSARVRRLSRELDKVKAGDEVELRVYRAGQARTVKVTTAAARDVERSGRSMFIIGDNAGMGDFNFAVPPVPPMAPLPPLPPNAPQFYFFDDDGEGAVRLRMSPRLRTDVRERTRQAIERALEIAPRARGRVRVQMDDLDDADGVAERTPTTRAPKVRVVSEGRA